VGGRVHRFHTHSSLWVILQMKAKELTGQDIEIDVADIDTDVNVDLDLNTLARTDGIVSTFIFNKEIYWKIQGPTPILISSSLFVCTLKAVLLYYCYCSQCVTLRQLLDNGHSCLIQHPCPCYLLPWKKRHKLSELWKHVSNFTWKIGGGEVLTLDFLYVFISFLRGSWSYQFFPLFPLKSVFISESSFRFYFWLTCC
jgi:hypothetical protein